MTKADFKPISANAVARTVKPLQEVEESSAALPKQDSAVDIVINYSWHLTLPISWAGVEG